ncbi:hypothetical protein M9H77_17322 [Catharanthus roseus]|uniref:Uncharacterized protein n=1 Tax=Catharanthus roseus TaxID=4058 RepID=A0ACC0B497_CATRO|nr:hypothetical protein M9H77_17322 [Catharanthus roseus]
MRESCCDISSPLNSLSSEEMNLIQSQFLDFLTTICGTKPNHGMKAKEEVGNVMGNPFTCNLSIDVDHMFKFSSPCAYFEKQLLSHSSHKKLNGLKLKAPDVADDERRKEGKKRELTINGRLHPTIRGSFLDIKGSLKSAAMIVFPTGNFHGIRANCPKPLIMSNDNIGNVDDDMVEESHVRRIKKDAYYGTISTTTPASPSPAPTPEQNVDHLLRNSIARTAKGPTTMSPAASSWWDIQNGGRRVPLNPPTVVELNRQATAEGAAVTTADLDE